MAIHIRIHKVNTLTRVYFGILTISRLTSQTCVYFGNLRVQTLLLYSIEPRLPDRRYYESTIGALPSGSATVCARRAQGRPLKTGAGQRIFCRPAPPFSNTFVRNYLFLFRARGTSANSASAAAPALHPPDEPPPEGADSGDAKALTHTFTPPGLPSPFAAAGSETSVNVSPSAETQLYPLALLAISE